MSDDLGMDNAALELMISLMERNAKDSAYVTNQLVESYKNSAEEYKAELEAVRYKIEKLLSGPYMPNPSAILAALYPNKDVINNFRDEL